MTWRRTLHRSGGRLKVLKLEFVLVLAAEIIQILYLILRFLIYERYGIGQSL